MSIIRLSETSATPDVIREVLQNFGYCVISHSDAGSIAQARARVLGSARAIGTPVSHDKHGTLLWDIRTQTKVTTAGRTFSEHSDEAVLHTDSQYRDAPEDAFCLYCIKAATCGGGKSFILTLDDLLLDLADSGIESDMIDALSNNRFPFAVPRVFETENDKFTFGPILGEGKTIRYRKDTLEQGMQAHGAVLPDVAHRAVEALHQIVLTSTRVQCFDLARGDLLWVNNKSTLHGRSSFRDAERHLLRARITW